VPGGGGGGTRARGRREPLRAQYKGSSKKEQMSIVFRIVHISGSVVQVKEYFLCFLEAPDQTGSGSAEVVLNFLEKNSIPLSYCRGQGYDNGSNMKGQVSGVQGRILRANPKALYVPCSCHSQNLVLCDAANSCVSAKCFFANVHRLYTLFAASVQRWEILRKHFQITMKPVCATRWESRIYSIKAVLFN